MRILQEGKGDLGSRSQVQLLVPFENQRGCVSESKVVFGVGCAWWDSIDKASRNAGTIPCCPTCSGLLYESSEQDWWRQVDDHERAGNPGYRNFVEWWRGQHFKTYEEARAAYDVYKIENGIRK